MRIALSEWYDWLVEAKYIDLINWQIKVLKILKKQVKILV